MFGPATSHIRYSSTITLHMHGNPRMIAHVILRGTATNHSLKYNLIQNSQAVKKVCGPQKGYGEKRCEIQGGGQEMAVMVG